MFDVHTNSTNIPTRQIDTIRDLQDAYDMAKSQKEDRGIDSLGGRSPDSFQGRAGKAWAEVGMGYGGNPDLFSSLGWVQLSGNKADDIIPWSWYPYRRDMMLRTFAKLEPMLAGAIFNIRSRIETLPYLIKGDIKSKTHYGQVIGRGDMGNGSHELFGKTIFDLLTQDNGFFWEKVGAGSPNGPLVGPVMQINHIDSNRCWRTFDPEFPVIYYNPYTADWHKLHYTRVVMGSDNSQPDEIARGIGFCAVSRIIRLSQIMLDTTIYKHEKISGNFTRAMLILKGITSKQVSKAKSTAEMETEADGLVYFRKIPILTTMREDASHEMIDFASLPDGFDVEKDTTLYVYCLAMSLGIDAREIWPATTSGATKGDAIVQHLKTQGKGIGYYLNKIRWAINWNILKDTGAEFAWNFTDGEQELQAAQISQVQIQNVGLMQAQGNISPKEGRALLIARDIISGNEEEEVKDGRDTFSNYPPDEDDMTVDAEPPEPPQIDQQQVQGDSNQRVQQHGTTSPKDSVKPVRTGAASIVAGKELDITGEDIELAKKALHAMGISIRGD
jgi:hypothetical protein